MASSLLPVKRTANRKLASNAGDTSFASRLGSSPIPFLFFLLTNATVFIRPSEIFESLQDTSIYEALIVGSLILSLDRVRENLRPRAVYQQPITACVIGLVVAILLSHLSHTYFFGAYESGTLFIKILIYYMLLVSLVTTPTRLRWFLLTTAICAFVMISMCVIDYAEIIDLPFVQHVVDRNGGVDELGEVALVLRMRGTGIFQDPNDLSILIVGTGVLFLYFMTDRKWGLARWACLVPLAVLCLGLSYTRSRGGLLAAAAAGMTLLSVRYGKKWAICGAAAGLCLLPLLAGRQGNLELDGGTSQDRIRLWSEGLQELKSTNLIFGIGQGLYADAVGQVAHNSYVHAFVELGLLGGMFFFGLFFFSALGLYRIIQVPPACVQNTELQRFAPFMAAMLAGWATGVYSLSRCYVVPTYMIFGLAAAYTNLAAIHLKPRRLLIVFDWPHIRRLAAGSVLLLVFLYIFVKIFVRFR